MAQNKSLTVSFFGRDVSLNRTLDGVKKNTFATSNVLEQGSRKATIAIAALSAAAYSFVKAAAEDEKGAVSLANTLKTVVGATDVQVANVEKFIKKSETFSTVVDDKLRPAFDTLVRSTGDVTKSQKLLTLALEIAQKEGVDVGQVTDAMAKASRGQFKALATLTKTLPKTTGGNKQYATSMKVVNGQLINVTKNLGTTKKATESLESFISRIGPKYKGSIEAVTGTTAFKMQQMALAFDNAKEALGYALMPYMIKFADWLTSHQKDIDKWVGIIGDVGPKLFFAALGMKALNATFKTFQAFKTIGTILMSIGTAAETAGVAGAAGGAAISSAWAPFFVGVAAVGGLAALGLFGYNMYKNRNTTPDFGKKGSFLNPTPTKPFNSATLGSMPLPGIPKFASGGIVSRPTIGMIGEAGPEAIIPLSKGGFGVTINNYIQGSVVTEKELALRVRNDMAQLLRRKGINPAVLGV